MSCAAGTTNGGLFEEQLGGLLWATFLLGGSASGGEEYIKRSTTSSRQSCFIARAVPTVKQTVDVAVLLHSVNYQLAELCRMCSSDAGDGALAPRRL